MLARTVLLAISASAGLVAAQGKVHTQFSPDLTQVKQEVLDSWCPSQRAVCPQLCGGAATPNECFLDTLTYTCDCVDGSRPNMSDYTGTLEANACIAYVSECVEGNTTNPGNQDICLNTNCGHKDPASVTKGSGGSGGPKTQTSSSPSSTTSGGGSGSSPTGGASGGSAPSGAAVALVPYANAYGTSALVGGILAVFGLAL